MSTAPMESIVTIVVAVFTALLLTSNTCVFIIGILCGHCCTKKRVRLDQESMHSAGGSSSINRAPIYENVDLNTPEQYLELQENVAYCHIIVNDSELSQ